MPSRTRKPPVDRHQLQQIVSGLSEGVVLIDPAGTVVWANETALAIHGVETLAQFGEDAAAYARTFRLRYRNRHELPAAQYPIRRALRQEAFADVVVEVTRRDDLDFRRIHQVRSLALTDAAGDVESLVLAIQDVSERYEAEQRFERTFAANPAPALICRVADLRYVKVNDGFLEMTGYRREDVLDHSAYEIDVLDGAPEREAAIANLHAGRTIAQTEATLKLPDGSSKYVIVAGQPISLGEEECMLFTFIDLDLRKKAEDALRHSERRFSTAFRLAPVPMMLATLSPARLIEVNEAFLAATGCRIDPLVGDGEPAVWQDARAFAALLAQVERDGSVRDHEMALHGRDGSTIDCLASAEAVSIDDAPCALCVFQDITERKRSEAELITAIEAVMQDASWFSRTVIEKLALARRSGSKGGQAELADLTPREREVLGLICEGLSDADIAHTLRMSRHTVRNHVATIYSKIDVHRRSAAVVWARERGIVGYEPPAKRAHRTPK